MNAYTIQHHCTQTTTFCGGRQLLSIKSNGSNGLGFSCIMLNNYMPAEGNQSHVHLPHRNARIRANYQTRLPFCDVFGELFRDNRYSYFIEVFPVDGHSHVVVRLGFQELRPKVDVVQAELAADLYVDGFVALEHIRFGG